MTNRKFIFSIKAIFDKTGITKTTTALKTLNTTVETTDKEFVKTAKTGKKSFAALQKNITTFNKSLTSGIKTLGDWGKKLGLAAAGAATAVGGLAVSAANFNIEIARAATMSDNLGFKELRQQALEMSQSIGVAKTEISSGLYQALSASVPEENLFSFVSTAARIAVTDGSSVESAVDGLSTVINAFQLDASQTDKVADAMFKTVANGKTTFGELADSMATAAPTAAALGVGYDQVLAAVATLTKQGVPTATALNQIRNNMLTLNTELGEGWTKTHTFQEALEEVAEKGGYSATKLEKAFGKENVAGVLALVGDNAKGARQDLEELSTSAGTLQEKFQQVEQHTYWDKAWKSAQAAIQQVGNVLTETIKPLVTSVTTQIQGWTSNTEFWDRMQAKLAKVREELTNIITALQNDPEGLSKVGDILKLYAKTAAAEAINILATGIVKVGDLLGKAVIDYMKSHALDALKFSANPMLYGINKAADFVKGQFARPDEKEESAIINVIDTSAWQQQTEEIYQTLNTTGEKIREGMQQSSETYNAQLTTSQDEINAGIETAGNSLSDASEAITDGASAVTAAADTGAQQIDTQTAAAEKEITAATDTLKTAATNATGTISTSIADMSTGVKQMAATTTQGLNQINANLSTTYNTINSTLQSILSQLADTQRTAAKAEYQASLNQSQLSNMR